MTEDDNQLIADKWVRVLADSCADGVWSRDGAAMSADTLPVSQELIVRIRAWQAWYDRDEDDWGLFRGDVESFSRAGLDVARAIKDELPDWQVIYFDEAAYGRHKNGQRDLFEYEV